MRIAIINEISAAEKNADILKALDGRGLEVINLGNTRAGDSPELLYTHTGLMSALLLHLKAVDMVIGGCGTGIGYLNSVVQYPGVICGHLLNPLDAFLFARINAGNCVSLALNQGYGWAGDVNLRMIFDELFTHQVAAGYPPHRAEPQRQGRELMTVISQASHRPFAEIIQSLPLAFTEWALEFPAYKPLLLEYLYLDSDLESVISKIL